MPFQGEKEMKTLKSANIWALSTLGIAMLLSPNAKSQPMDDKVTVTMPYTTTIGHKTLAPGDYVIRRMPSPGGSRVLLVYSDEGMKFETSAMTIPVLDQNVARDTKVILSKVGDDYYYDKVWVQGKSYGYQFILPKEARDRQRELVAVNGRSGGGSSTITTTTTTETAQAEQPVVAEEQTVAVTQPVEESKSEVQTETEIAQAEVPPAPVSEPEEAPLPQSADRAAEEQAPAPAREELPATAAGWMAMVLGGGSLLGMGLKLRRKA
jgi:hypothetical protein